jgi:hypothetical protein
VIWLFSIATPSPSATSRSACRGPARWAAGDQDRHEEDTSPQLRAALPMLRSPGANCCHRGESFQQPAPGQPGPHQPTCKSRCPADSTCVS